MEWQRCWKHRIFFRVVNTGGIEMDFFITKNTTEHVNHLLATGRSQEAVNLCQEACAAPTATPQEWLIYGNLSAEMGDLATARTAYAKAAELDSELAEAHFGLGKVLAAAGEYPEALDHLQNAAQLQPDNPDILLTLGITCGLTKQMTKAEEYCRQSLELQPGSANARFHLGNALHALGRSTEAEAEYEAALKLQPDTATVWSMLAQARVRLSKFAEAKVAATRALTLNPRLGGAHYTLGSISEALGDKEQARDYYRHAVELLPGFLEAHLSLGKLLINLGDFADATRSLQAAANLSPASTKVHFLMGRCFKQLGLPEKALDCYRRVVDLNRDHLQAHYSIAAICANSGDNNLHAEAAEHLAEVLRINPDDGQARHMLAAFQGQTTSVAPADYIKTLFDGFADTFDEKLVNALGYRAPEVLYDMVSHVVTPASGTLDVIDLGCGTGLCAPLFRGMARTLHGVDLSPRMIEKAHERALYDALEVNDVVSCLASSVAAWDLAISSDVFVYVGDIHDIFYACAKALRPGGMLVFSIEAGDDVDTFILRNTGRYAHARKYIHGLAAQTGFTEIECRPTVLRKNAGQDINGYLFLLQRSGECINNQAP